MFYALNTNILLLRYISFAPTHIFHLESPRLFFHSKRLCVCVRACCAIRIDFISMYLSQWVVNNTYYHIMTHHAPLTESFINFSSHEIWNSFLNHNLKCFLSFLSINCGMWIAKLNSIHIYPVNDKSCESFRWIDMEKKFKFVLLLSIWLSVNRILVL